MSLGLRHRRIKSAAWTVTGVTSRRVRVPEKHDLVLMKTIRGYEHDLQAAEEIHANSPLDLEVLVRRFQEEMDPVGPPGRFRANFLALVERLFPKKLPASPGG